LRSICDNIIGNKLSLDKVPSPKKIVHKRTETKIISNPYYEYNFNSKTFSNEIANNSIIKDKKVI
jgi:hypothetical protein